MKIGSLKLDTKDCFLAFFLLLIVLACALVVDMAGYQQRLVVIPGIILMSVIFRALVGFRRRSSQLERSKKR